MSVLLANHVIFLLTMKDIYRRIDMLCAIFSYAIMRNFNESHILKSQKKISTHIISRSHTPIIN